MAWAKTTVLVETITSYIDNRNDSDKLRRSFVNQFRNYINAQDYISINGRYVYIRTNTHFFSFLLKNDLKIILHFHVIGVTEGWNQTR